MKFALSIHGAFSQSQSAYSALKFAEAVLARGHSIERLFFYQDGVHNATQLAQLPQGEFDLPSVWQQFVQQHQLDAVVCIAAALRRGVVNEAEASRYNLAAASLAQGYELSGLGQLVDAAVTADRLVTFGG